MKRVINIPLAIIALLFLSSCEDIFEIDLTDSPVELIIPQDHLTTSISTQLFWWEQTYGATQYHFQIVQPSFDSIISLVHDAYIDTNRIEVSLAPGKYQWRVQARNNATMSTYYSRSLTIDSTLDLSGQSIVLVSPKNNDTTKSLVLHFDWQDLYNSDTYYLEIWQPNTTGTLVKSEYITNSEYSYTLPSEGTYSWRVRGENSTSSTPYSIREIFIDTTSPNAPTLVSPGMFSTVQNPVTFNWVRNSSSGSSTYDSLILAIDTNFIQLDRTIVTPNSQYSDSLAIGQYYWQVFTKDKAGNTSPGSVIRKFTVL